MRGSRPEWVEGALKVDGTASAKALGQDCAASVWGPVCCCLYPGCLGWGSCGGLLCGPDPCPHRIRLFQMNLGPPKKLEELDPETREYWRLLRKHNIWRHNRLSKNRKF